MKPEWLLLVPVSVTLAGCGVLSQGKGVPSAQETPKMLSPLTGHPVALPQRPAPPVPTPAPKKPTLTAADFDYLRWLMQFDAATREIIAQQARALPPPREQQDQTRFRAMLNKWEDSQHEAGVLRTKSSMATEYSFRLQHIQSQFKARPAPPACAAIASAYAGVLVGYQNTADFNTRLYRQFALLMQNPRGASQMIPPEFQDGGAVVDIRLQGEVQNAKAGANAALTQLFQRFPDEIPPEIAGFRVQ